MFGEVPQKVEVTVQINANTGRNASSRRSRVTILAPKVAIGLVMADTVRVRHGDENDSCTKGFLDVGVGVCLVAICKTFSVLVGIEEVRDKVYEVVRATSLTSVDARGKVNVLLVLLDLLSLVGHTTPDCVALEGLVRRLKQLQTIFFLQAFQSCVDFVGVQDASTLVRTIDISILAT